MGAEEAQSIDGLVDTTRYPLADPGSTTWQAMVGRARRDLDAVGCAVLPGFVRPELTDVLREEGERVAPLAHHEVATVNAYNIDVGTALPDGHPGAIPLRRGNAFVARDRIPPGFAVHRLYTDRLFQAFVAACVGLPEVHPLADPLAGLCLNVVSPGREHPWHFDTNEFTVSLLVREPEAGGTFEFCPGIRTATDENFDAVRAVLEGTRPDAVRRLPLRPGDLQLFMGRYALHRVTEVRGGTPRLSAIFAYSARPGVVGRAARTRQLFGRALPEHLEAEGRAVRADRLLD